MLVGRSERLNRPSGAATDGGLTKLGLGTLTLNAAATATYSGATAVSAGTLRVVPAIRSLPAVLGAVNVSSGATLALAPHPAGTGPYTVVVGPLTLAGAFVAYTGKVDVTNDDLDLPGGNLATVTLQAAQGFAGGT